MNRVSTLLLATLALFIALGAGQTPPRTYKLAHGQKINRRSKPQRLVRGRGKNNNNLRANPTCSVCGQSEQEGKLDLNCCWPGGSWHDSCGPNQRHTWRAGWFACNAEKKIWKDVPRLDSANFSKTNSLRAAADMWVKNVQEHGDPAGHFGRGMSRLCPWVSNSVTHRGFATVPGVGVFYIVSADSTNLDNAKNVAFFAARGLFCV